MNKTPSLFARNFDLPGNPLTTDFSPGTEWVLDGIGEPTRKYDGTCVMLDNAGKWWARREVKPGKNPPPNFQPVEEDDVTLKLMGWEPIEQTGFVKYLKEALDTIATMNGETLLTYDRPGTYELCGPKINGNPEGYLEHVLIYHKDAEKLRVTQPLMEQELRNVLFSVVYSTRAKFDVVKSTVTWLNEKAGWEGIVWHHPNGEYVKIKARDFK